MWSQQGAHGQGIAADSVRERPDDTSTPAGQGRGTVGKPDQPARTQGRAVGKPDQPAQTQGRAVGKPGKPARSQVQAQVKGAEENSRQMNSPLMLIEGFLQALTNTDSDGRIVITRNGIKIDNRIVLCLHRD